MEILFETDGPGIKKPYHLKNNVFLIYSPRTITIDVASSIKIDTNIILRLPKKAKAFITSKLRAQEIYEINKEKSRLWIETLNTSYNEDFKIKKRHLLDFLLLNQKIENLNMTRKKSQKRRKFYRKTGNRHGNCTGKKRSRQREGFLNRYDFPYAGKDTVNQVSKIASGIIKQATGEIDKIVQNRINQIIRSGGAEVERVLPKILRGAIEDIYRTPFRMLGNFGKQQFKKIKNKILR